MNIGRINPSISKIENTNIRYDNNKLNINKKDNFSKEILKQIQNIQQQINKLHENDNMQTKEKLEQIENLKQQIDDLNKLLVEKQLEKQKKEEERLAKSNKEIDEKNKTEINKIIEVNNTTTKVKIMNNIKSSIKGEARVLKIEAELDSQRSHGVSGEKIIKKKLKKANEKENRINNINEKIYEEVSGRKDTSESNIDERIVEDKKLKLI